MPRDAASSMLRWSISAMLVVTTSSACAPDLDDRQGIIREPRFIGVTSVPAEAEEGTPVTYHALFVGPPGPLQDSDLDWALCSLRKPLAVLGPVHPDCIESTGPGLEPIGTGHEILTSVPRGACRTFGPEPPDTADGEPPGRPVDPDETTGYYQPVRVWAPGTGDEPFAIGQTRLYCGLATATGEQISAYRRRYTFNRNPELESARLVGDGGVIELEPIDEDPTLVSGVVAPGAEMTWRVSWPGCPASVDDLDETGCGGAEPFVDFDLERRILVDRRESVRVAWFATDGELDVDRTGRDEDDPERFSENVWTAPEERGIVDLWVVLRDVRGGSGWRHYRIEVQ
jgi:hypothetical protein